MQVGQLLEKQKMLELIAKKVKGHCRLAMALFYWNIFVRVGY